jgi:hypothetical protein
MQETVDGLDLPGKGYTSAVIRRAVRLASALLVAQLIATPGARAQAKLPQGAPAALACLAEHFSIEVEPAATGFTVRLPDGQRVPWDDGRHKSFDEMLDAPDLQDMFALPYPTGPIEKVSTPDTDPGRVRVEALYVAAYPSGDAHVRTVDFLGHPMRVQEKVAAPLARVAARLEQARTRDPALGAVLARLVAHPGGTIVRRHIAGTGRTSAHAWGIAVDLDPDRAHYWRWDRPMRWRNEAPQVLVDAFEAEGFIWGGRWYHYDTMHFEYRPELLCAAHANARP